MSELSTYQEALKKASSTIEQLVGEVDRLKKKEPIAIIGIGCRLPGGANSPEEYWRLLSEGRDAISSIPSGRWNADRYYDENPEAPGKMYVREGGFLDCSLYDFDPRFFGISPKEAKALDPQQRLLLEVTWEAVEDAGINPASLHGSRTGVFIGISSDDYQSAHLHSGDPSLIDPYSLTGFTASTAAGRISYILGLEGPNFPVDTACSSSLVSLHLACRSLQAGECDLALVGGVNLMLTPEPLIAFCKLRALSPEGRCKTFDASANGYSRGEGCGMIVLKRHEAAERDGDRILALVKGSSLNNDGRSNGFTTPNGLAQRRVIISALEDSNLQPADIDYVEAHGTGTPLGDPIEVEAIAAVFGKSHDTAHPLLIGSAKTNIGHLEAAAGIAGIIKLILAMDRENIPPHLHFSSPNPHIAWGDMPLKVVARGAPWPRSARPRRAGISGFGFSGTNAHVILEEAPLPDKPRLTDGRSSHLLIMSGVDETALRAIAGRYCRYLEEPSISPLATICNTAATGRNRFSQGLAVAGTTPHEIAQRLSAFADQGKTSGLYLHSAQETGRRGPVFLFTGQGSQYPGMGKEIYETAPVYRDALDRCDTLFAPLLGLSIRDLMHEGSEEELARTIFTQPAIFSLEYSLAVLWRSWGVVPSALLGHSIGEFVAACFSGVLSLEDAVTLVAHRGRLMNSLPAGGVMAALLCPEEQALPLIAPYGKNVSVAAVNSLGTVVISGEQGGVAAALEIFRQQGISFQYLTVSHAFHSHLMDPVLDEFERIAARIHFHEPLLPVISNLTGRPAVGDDLRTAAYWRQHLRGAVRFSDSVEYLKHQGDDLFLEIGASATLSSFVRQSAAPLSRCAASLKRGVSPWSTLTAALGDLFAAGVAIDWKRYDEPYRAGRASIPTYPFQRERYFMDPVHDPAVRGTADGLSTVGKKHPLLGSRLDSPSPENRFAGEIGTNEDAWLTGHVINGAVIIPAAAYLEMALAAVSEKLSPVSPVILEQARFLAPLVLTEERRTLQTIFRPETGEVEVFSRSSNCEWQLHAGMTAVFTLSTELSSPAPTKDLTHAPRIERDGATFYNEVLDKGYRYGGVFRSIRTLEIRGEEVSGIVSVPEAEAGRFLLHPALLDGCLTLAGASFLYGAEPLPDGILFVPTSIESLLFSGRGGHVLNVHCLRREKNKLSAIFDLFATDQQGEPVLQLTGLNMRRIRKEQFAPVANSSIAPLLFSHIWRELPLSLLPESLSGRWLLLRDHTPICAAVSTAIRGTGADLTEVKADNHDFGNVAEPSIDPFSYESLLRLLSNQHESGSPFTGIISLRGDSLEANLNLVRALLAARLTTRLFFVTSAVHDPYGMNRDINPEGASLWGLGATVAAEAPGLCCKLLDLSPKPDGDELAALLREIAATDCEDRVALHGRVRFVPRLLCGNGQTGTERVKFHSAPAGRGMIDPAGCYLVTGGTGFLGLKIAGWLLDQGCRHLVLMGRSAPSVEAHAAMDELRRSGAEVALFLGDVAEEADVTRIMAELRAIMPPLKGIFHAAGLLDDAMLPEMDSQKLDRVMRPKIDGAWNLHRSTEKDNLELFVLFSSLTAVTGSPGQANYAAANAALDGFARWRRALGMPTVSINWGPWGEGGLAARDGNSDRLSARGIRSIDTETALQALAEVLQNNLVEQCVADIDLNRLSSFVPSTANGLYAELFSQSDYSSGDTPPDSMRLDAIRAASPAERPAAMLLLVQELASIVMGQSNPARIESDRPLQEQGFDSLMAVDLRNLITKTFAVELPVSLLFDYPTPEKISRFLLEDVLASPEAIGKSPVASAVELGDEKTADDLVDEIEQLLGF